MPSTIQFHRVFAAPPDRVYRAFTHAGALVKWLPPHGFTAQIHGEFAARVGGGYKMSFTNLTTMKGHSFKVTFTEMKPNESIKHTDQFDDPNLPGEMHVTVTFRKVICGTELNITQAGIPDAIPAEMCHLGWQQSLDLLRQLVEPEIPG